MTGSIRSYDRVPAEEYLQRPLIVFKPSPIDVRRGYYVNGIFNTRRESWGGANALFSTLEGRVKIYSIHSASETLRLDSCRRILQRQGEDVGFLVRLISSNIEVLRSVKHMRNTPDYTNFESRQLHREIEWNSLALNAMDDPRNLYLIGFSRGNCILNHACRDLTELQRSRLVIIGCGPVMDIPRSLGDFTQNFVARTDGCSLVFHPGLASNPDKYKDVANIRLLGLSEGLYGLTTGHYFLNELYQDAIAGAVRPFLISDDEWFANHSRIVDYRFDFSRSWGPQQWDPSQLYSQHPLLPVHLFSNLHTNATSGNQPTVLDVSANSALGILQQSEIVQAFQGDGCASEQQLAWEDAFGAPVTQFPWQDGSGFPAYNPKPAPSRFFRSPVEITCASGTVALFGATVGMEFGAGGTCFYVAASMALPAAAVLGAITGGVLLYNHIKDNRIKHFGERLQGFLERSSKQFDAVIAADNILQDLLQNPPKDPDQFLKYKKDIRSALSARYDAACAAIKDTDKLANHTESDYLARKRRDGLIGHSTKDVLIETVHPQANANLQVLIEIRDGRVADLESYLKGADAQREIAVYNLRLSEWKNLTATIEDATRTPQERSKALEQLQSLNPLLCRQHVIVSNLPEGLRPTNLADPMVFQNIIANGQKDAAFVVGSIDENRTELQALKNERREDYLRLGVLYGRKLIDLKDYSAAATHIAEWISLVGQDTPPQDVLDMVANYFQTLPSAVNANPAEMLAAFNAYFGEHQALTTEEYERMTKQKGLLCVYSDDYSPEAGLLFKAGAELFPEGPVRAMMQSRFLDTEFWSRSHEQNLEEWRETLTKNTSQSLHLAKLIHKKLCHEGKFHEAAEFAKVSIQTLPQDASWKDVIEMVQANIQALSHESGASLVEFRRMYIEWLGTRPDLNSVGELKILQGHLHLLDRDYCPEAVKCIRGCVDLLPDGQEKTLMRAIVDVSENEWSKAKTSLEPEAELSSEQASVVRQYLVASEQRMYQFGLELVSYLYSNHIAPRAREAFLEEAGIGSVAFNSVDALMQIAMNPLASEWYLAKLSSFPEDLRHMTQPLGMISRGYFGLQLLNGLVLRNAIDLFSSNPTQRRVWHDRVTTPLSVFLEGAGIVSRVSSLMASESSSPYSYANIGMLVSSLALNLDALSDHRMLEHRYSRPMLQTAVRVQRVALPVTIALGNIEAIRSCSAFVASRVPLISPILEQLGVVAARVIPVASAALTVVSIIWMIDDYRRSCAATTMEQAQRLFSKGKRKESRRVLEEARDWSIGDSAVVAQYADCTVFIETIPHLTATQVSKRRLGELMPKVREALATLKKSSQYKLMHSSLLMQIVIAHLSAEEYQLVDKILQNPSTITEVHEQVAHFLIRRAESLAQEALYKEAENDLQQMLQQFSAFAFQSLLLHYKNYMGCQRKHPIIKCGETTEIAERLKAIDDMLNRLRGDRFSELRENLQRDKICVYFATGNYPEAQALLRRADTSLHNKWTLHLIHYAKRLCKKGQNAEAAAYLEAALTHLPSLKDRVLIEKYKNYIALQQEQSEIGAIDAVIAELSVPSCITRFSQLYSELQWAKVLHALESNDFIAVKSILRQIRSIATDAKTQSRDSDFLLSQMESAFHDQLIVHLIEQTKKMIPEEAIKILRSAYYNLNPFNHSALLEKYRKYIACLQSTSLLAEGSEERTRLRLSALEAVLAELPHSHGFESPYFYFQCDKIHIYLKGGDFESVNIFIEQMKHKISQTEKDFQEAVFLEPVESAIHKQLAMQVIEQAEDMDDTHAVEYLSEAHSKLSAFHHLELIRVYKEYRLCQKRVSALPNKSPEIKTLKISAIDAVLAELRNQGLSNLPFRFDFEWEKIYLYLEDQDFKTVNILLREMNNKIRDGSEAEVALSQQMESAIHNRLFFHLIKIVEKMDENDSVEYLRKVYLNLLSTFRHVELIKEFKDYFSRQLCASVFPEGSPMKIERMISAIDILLAKISASSLSEPLAAQLYENFLIKKLLICFLSKRYREIKTILEDPKLTPEIRIKFANDLANILIRNVDSLPLQKRKGTLLPVVVVMGIDENPAIQKYVAHLEEREKSAGSRVIYVIEEEEPTLVSE